MFDNEDGGFGEELDFSEVSIARRLVRGGEGQYLVNRTPVRRTDLVELLADVGLGGTMHSIVSQGKVDAVLASKPEDRRALVEEAAGLGKFKRRRHRAELKLARVATQVERARDVEEEVRKRLRPLALQATAAERAEKLAGEIATFVRASRRSTSLRSRSARRRPTRGGAQPRSRAARRRRGSAVLAEREAAEVELSDAAGAREGALGALYRLQGAGERLSVRSESLVAHAARLGEDLADAERAARRGPTRLSLARGCISRGGGRGRVTPRARAGGRRAGPARPGAARRCRAGGRSGGGTAARRRPGGARVGRPWPR